MQVEPDKHKEYEKRHSPIWAELKSALKAGGAHNYSIFLNKETNQLFGYVEIEDEKRWENIARTDICQKWWAYMSDIMAANPDGSPVAKDLNELFHLK